jgi:hypothetical protein
MGLIDTSLAPQMTVDGMTQLQMPAIPDFTTMPPTANMTWMRPTYPTYAIDVSRDVSVLFSLLKFKFFALIQVQLPAPNLFTHAEPTIVTVKQSHRKSHTSFEQSERHANNRTTQQPTTIDSYEPPTIDGDHTATAGAASTAGRNAGRDVDATAECEI